MGGTDRNIGEIEALYRQHGAALLLFASAISGFEMLAVKRLTRFFIGVGVERAVGVGALPLRSLGLGSGLWLGLGAGLRQIDWRL